MAPEVRPEQLGGKEGRVRERVGLGGQGCAGPHRKRERLVLLDQIEEPRAAEISQGSPRDVRCPPGSGDEGVATADLQTRSLAPEGQLDPVQSAGQTCVALDLPPPVAGEGSDRIDGDDPDAMAGLREAPGEVELADVTPEEMAQVNG